MKMTRDITGRFAFVRDAFFAQAGRPPDAALIMWCAGMAAFCCAMYMALTVPALQTGDGARYLQTIRGWTPPETPVHCGYYFLGKIWFNAASWMFASEERCLNSLSAATAGIGSFMFGLLGRRLLGSSVGAVFAQFSLSFAYFFVLQAVFAEVYIIQTTFVIATLLLLLAGREVLSALAFAFAVTVSPSSLFILPVVLLFVRKFRDVVVFGLVSMALVVSVVLPVWHDYFLGSRGLLRAAGIHLSIVDASLKELMELVRFGPAVLLVPVGILALASRPEGRYLLMAIMSSWLAHFIVGERFDDVPVQFPTFALLMVSCGAAVVWMNERLTLPHMRVACLVGLALFEAACCVFSARRVAKSGLVALRWRETYEGIAASGLHRVIAEWSPGTLFEHYSLKAYQTGRWINCENLRGTWGASRRDESSALLRDAIVQREAIWLLDAPPDWALAAIAADGYHLTERHGLKVAIPGVVQEGDAGMP